MRYTTVLCVLAALLSVLMSQPSMALFPGSRTVRADNPGVVCDIGPPGSGWVQVSADPAYALLDGNVDMAQDPSTFFFTGTQVDINTSGQAPNPALYCVPPSSGNAAVNNAQLDPTANRTDMAGTNPVAYEWFLAPNTCLASSSSDPTCNDQPEVEVVVWTLPASPELPKGGVEIEFDGWCGNPGFAFQDGLANLTPWFVWDGSLYTYGTNCSSDNGTTSNFNGYDLLIDSTGALAGYVTFDPANSNDSNTVCTATTTSCTFEAADSGWTVSPIPVPTALAATAAADGTVTLTWTAPGSWATPPTQVSSSGAQFQGPTGYYLYSTADAGTPATAPCSSTVITTTSTSPPQSCPGPFYTVAAVYAGAVSAQSEAASASSGGGSSSSSSTSSSTGSGMGGGGGGALGMLDLIAVALAASFGGWLRARRRLAGQRS